MERTVSLIKDRRVLCVCSTLRWEDVTLQINTRMQSYTRTETHTQAMSTCDWQQSSIRGLPCMHPSREAFTETYQSSTWWHAYFRLPFLHSTSRHFSSSTPPLPCFPPSHFPLIISLRNDMLATCSVNIPQSQTHLPNRSLPPALKCSI